MAFPKAGRVRGRDEDGDAVDKLCDFLSSVLSEDQFNKAADLISAIQDSHAHPADD